MKLPIFLFSILISPVVLAQYSQFSHGNKTDNLELIQVDFLESSTILHFEYNSPEERVGTICIREETYLQDKSSYKKFELMNSYNLPLCDKYHVMDEKRLHRFSLEFEKLPDSIANFDFIESGDNSFEVRNIKIDYQNTSSLIDIDGFTNGYSVKEKGIFYKDGIAIQQFMCEGVFIAAYLERSKSYGSYYQVNFVIQNLTGKSINFDPSQTEAQLYAEGEPIETYILSHQEYSKKVATRQGWAAFAKGFSEGMAAYNAGYSNSTSYSSTNSSAYGKVGNTYGSAYGSSSTTTYTRTYDAGAAYTAQQNANKNINEFNQQQYEVRQTLSEGYAKLNTIPNETEYIAYINLKYKKADNLIFVIQFNGKKYTFIW